MYSPVMSPSSLLASKMAGFWKMKVAAAGREGGRGREAGNEQRCARQQQQGRRPKHSSRILHSTQSRHGTAQLLRCAASWTPGKAAPDNKHPGKPGSAPVPLEPSRLRVSLTSGMVGSSMPLMNCMLLAMATTRRAASGARTEARAAAGRARVKAAAARGAARGAGGGGAGEGIVRTAGHTEWAG